MENTDQIYDIRKELEGMAEEKYRAFSAKLLPPGTELLGVRLPALRKLARAIAAGNRGMNWKDFLQQWGLFLDADAPEKAATPAARTPALEELLLMGMVIGYAKCPAEERLEHIRSFVPRINNWSVCDSFVSTLKFTSKNKELVWDFLQPYFDSPHEYHKRFACVMILNYYRDEADLQRDLEALDRLSHQPYYTMMAVAWAISILYIHHPDEVGDYLKRSHLDDVTYKKAIQKILESRQIQGSRREEAKALRDLRG